MRHHRKYDPLKQRMLIIIGLLIILLFAIGSSRQYFMRQINQLDKQNYSPLSYEQHYAFIVGDSTDSFDQEVYESAKQAGKKLNAYVEFMGKDLSVHYDKMQLMDIAVDAKVDGIIVEGDESSELKEKIARASERGIPVVTFGCDCTPSERKCYVGINNYTLGREYAANLAQLKAGIQQNIVILMSDDYRASQGIINTSIREYLDSQNSNYQIENIVIPQDRTFSSEEAIRDLFVKNRTMPDFLICLNEQFTNCAIQAVIDFNKVGDVGILGYFTNDTILDAIRENIVHSTIGIDTKQLGTYCVEAVHEYLETGYVNEYQTVDVTMITENNVMEYVKDEGKEVPNK